MKSKPRKCIMCNGAIDTKSLSFEQQLVDDKDFCRKCWDEIMVGGYSEEIPLPVLIVEVS